MRCAFPPYVCDLDVEVAVFDYRSWPDGVDDLVSRDEVARAIDQQPENVERTPADRYRQAGGAQIGSAGLGAGRSVSFRTPVDASVISGY